MNSTPSGSSAVIKASGWRGAWFRLVAIGVGLAPFVVCELTLRIGGWGRVSDAVDPFVGFAAVHPLFELSQDGQRHEIPDSRQSFFRPESFSVEKPPNGFRIFCLGGSTVQGRPFSTETSFTSWLELSLRAADPSRAWEVVNCGGISYASYRLTPILLELLEHEPDLFVIYTGHNEFLEDRTYRAVKRTPRWIVRTHGTLTRLRTYNVLRSWWVGSEKLTDRPVLPSDVDALLDYKGGLEDYVRDDGWRRDIREHFEFNLRQMIHLAGGADVPVILVNPVSDLENTPPFKFAHGDGIAAAEREAFLRLWDEARSLDATPQGRIEALRKAIAIDDRHAGVHFLLGRLYETRGDLKLAMSSYICAKDEDICPLRMLEPMHEAILCVAAETQAILIDARQLFQQWAGSVFPGEKWLVDHVHPTIAGHRRLAEHLVLHMEHLGLTNLATGWEGRRDVSYRVHLKGLEPDYYIRGRQRLDGLKRWSQGRASGVKSRGK